MPVLLRALGIAVAMSAAAAEHPKGDVVGDVRLGAVSVDCPDPAGLGDFYKNVLDLDVMFSSPDLVALQGAGVLLTFERVADHQRPSWPVGPVPKQLHLDSAVSDLDTEESRILALGSYQGRCSAKSR
jgi:hypothetical protein